MTCLHFMIMMDEFQVVTPKFHDYDDCNPVTYEELLAARY
jgi:hypothetical protein